MASLTKEYSKEKLTGQVFTPDFVVDKILDDIGYNSIDVSGKTILDPACGDGRFLLKIAERIIKYSKAENLISNLEKIYGWDIDESALKSAENKLNKLIKPLKINVNWNLFCLNALHKGQEENVKMFDYIVGNPPYIRIQHLVKKERNFIRTHYSLCKSGNTDIYIAFYELALHLLSKDGICGYITPNTFFHTETARFLRNYFANHQNLIQITNYGHIQLFENATTYNAIVIFDKNKRNEFLFQSAKNQASFNQNQIKFSDLKNKKFWQLSVNKLSSVKGKRLGDIADIHVGITTLADKVYIMPFEREDGEYLLLNSKHRGSVKIEKGILKPIVKVSVLKSPDEAIREYVLFPYKKVNGKHTIIPEHELKLKYPWAYSYLLSVKDVLDKRDNGKINKTAWYAFGRSQALDTSFGEKILFSPMNKKPNFIFYKNKEATFYSGYCIKYSGDVQKLLEQLNSARMAEYIQISARDFRGGWKAYNKKIVQEFVVY